MTQVYKNKHALLAGLILSIASFSSVADTSVDIHEPLELQKIMAQLGHKMQLITDAINNENWTLIEKNAAYIADHPRPPMSEKLKIMAFMGTDMAKFKDYDGETHKAAKVLVTAAKNKNGYTIIEKFAALQNTCLSCHQKFRPGFKAHFYAE